jgi:hypothetical protein
VPWHPHAVFALFDVPDDGLVVAERDLEAATIRQAVLEAVERILRTVEVVAPLVVPHNKRAVVHHPKPHEEPLVGLAAR